MRGSSVGIHFLIYFAITTFAAKCFMWSEARNNARLTRNSTRIAWQTHQVLHSRFIDASHRLFQHSSTAHSWRHTYFHSIATVYLAPLKPQSVTRPSVHRRGMILTQRAINHPHRGARISKWSSKVEQRQQQRRRRRR